jgi:hypothetical protein
LVVRSTFVFQGFTLLTGYQLWGQSLTKCTKGLIFLNAYTNPSFFTMGSTQSASRDELADMLQCAGLPDYSNSLFYQGTPIDAHLLQNITKRGTDHDILVEIVDQLHVDDADKPAIRSLAEDWFFDGRCMHQFLQLRGDEYYCVDCSRVIPNPETHHIRESPHPRFSGTDLHSCGLPIKWLVQWTNDRKCSSMTTFDVWRNFILTETRKERCRYVALDSAKPFTGPAKTFISHTWSGIWGDLIAAISYGADLDRRVWLDIFAVCQWPNRSRSPEFDFDDVIHSCSSFMVVCSIPSKDAEVRVDSQLDFHGYKKHSLCRLWCLAEVHAAAACQKRIPIIIQVVGLRNSGFSFNLDRVYLNTLRQNVDASKAQATVSTDVAMIQARFDNQGIGTLALNEVIKGVLEGYRCLEDDLYSVRLFHPNMRDTVPLYILVQTAACGDEVALSLLRHSPEAALVASALGFHGLLARLAQENISACTTAAGEVTVSPDLLQDQTGLGAIHHAARGGHMYCVEILINKFKIDANTPDRNNVTPLMHAASTDKSNAVFALLTVFGANVACRDGYGRCALHYAASAGGIRSVRCLVDHGAEVNCVDDKGFTPLMLAEQRGHDEVRSFLRGLMPSVAGANTGHVINK